MSFVKASLKNAKEAITTKKYEDAIKHCLKVLQFENSNYFAHVYLGVAYLNLNRHDESEQSYLRAIEIDHIHPLAWQGLEKFYEKQENWIKLEDIWIKLLNRYKESNDGKKVLDIINKLLDLYANKRKDRQKLIITLKYLSPTTSPYYELIQGLDGLQSPKQILLQLINLTEKEESESIKREIDSRRQRLNSGTLSSIKIQVESEIFSNSELEGFYDSLFEIIDSSANNLDRTEKNRLMMNFFKHLQKKLVAIPLENNINNNKQQLREKLFKLANELVEKDIAFPLPYEILIESTNTNTPDEYDLNLMKKYSEKFSDTGLSKIIQGYFITKQGEKTDAQELYNDGFELTPNSIFGHLVFSWFKHDSKDYELALEYAKNGKDLVMKYNKQTGYMLTRVLQSLELCMANCYLNIDAKFHADALSLYQKVLKVDSNNILALQGLGKTLAEQRQFEKSIKVFEKIFKLDSKNHSAKSELSWVYFMMENYDEAITLIKEAIDICDNNALHFYRLGRIYWAIGGEYQINKSYAYTQFIFSVKWDTQFSSSFTYLGHYYRLIENDNVRAKKCYEKAFSIDPHEEEAGIQLSEYYQFNNEENLAVGIYRAAIKANSRSGWAWKRLGFVELVRKNYLEAITDFQTALRTFSKDISCWEGLAEAYLHEGRYMASLKAFTRAIDLDSSSFNVHYQIGLVKQKLGIFNEAIDQYKLAIEKAHQQQAKVTQMKDGDHLPSLKGLGDCYLALSKEYFHSGFYGRAVESLNDGLLIMQKAIQNYNEYQCLWKLIGDLCMVANYLPNYLDLINLSSIRNIFKFVEDLNLDLNSKLHLPPEIDKIGLNLLNNSTNDDSTNNLLNNSDLLLILLTCGCLAYKYAILLTSTDTSTIAALWYDLGVGYYYIFENQSKIITELLDFYDNDNNYFNDDDDILLKNLLNVGIKCIKIALKLEPTNFNFWNALGIITFFADVKISQHSFIKAIDYSPKNPISWTNLGFLYLFNSDLELSSKAFSTAQSLDPDYVLAWVGQAYAANLYGGNEAAELFEHAYDISGGGYVLEADYGFAHQIYLKFKKSSFITTTTLHKSLLISPTFALRKLAEQRSDDAASLNLLGLLFEWLEQPVNSVEAFGDAIIALENKIDQIKNRDVIRQPIEGIDDNFIEKKELSNSITKKLAYVYGNFGRVLCSTREFEKSINAYNTTLNLIEQLEDDQSDSSLTTIRSFKIYTILGAGLAYYYNNELDNSLQMFEDAIFFSEQMQNNTSTSPNNNSIEIEEVRKDVIVLLSQVLWALGGEEQRNLAKEKLFECISQNPNHLPAIFGLCAMGLLQDDDTLTTATLREMKEIPIKVADKLDKDRDIDFLFSRYFLLQNSLEETTNTLSKSVRIRPPELVGWTRLSEHLISIVDPFSAVSISGTALKLISNSLSFASKNLPTNEKSKVYQNYTSALIIARRELKPNLPLIIKDKDISKDIDITEKGDDDDDDVTKELTNEVKTKEDKTDKGNKKKKNDKIVEYEKFGVEMLEAAQRAVRIAPWDLVGWSLLAVAHDES
ncbi:hypothetical protein Glove_202g69 [Diversispora epigaea]|uniref:Superkiller protein 3 n=1 Tax=Diversispora epigaea TaxID=1348612 RepID=A0A397IMF5_9GLOM|nr:hypothetical protein Glove_202g69 [Diversispora epigaea]